MYLAPHVKYLRFWQLVAMSTNPGPDMDEQQSRASLVSLGILLKKHCPVRSVLDRSSSEIPGEW